MLPTPNDLQSIVEEFLNSFFGKLRFNNLIFHHRTKNIDALAALEITALQRDEYISKLTYQDYIGGPKDDYLPTMPPYFEFAIAVKEHTVYVKINLGMTDKAPICISFHIAEFPITHYPLK